MNQFDGRSGPDNSAHRPVVRPGTVERHLRSGALLPSALLVACLLMTGCGGLTEPETRPTDLRTQPEQSPSATEEGKADGAAQSRQTAAAGDGGSAGASPEGTKAGAQDPNAAAREPKLGAADSAPAAPEPQDRASGSFGSMKQACDAISARMISVALAPMSYTYGGGRAEANAAVSKLAEFKDKVPPGLRDDFAKVQKVFAQSGYGYEEFDGAAFKTAVLPIERWVTSNCPQL